MKVNNYNQCLLVKGKRQQVAWIPGKFALMGKILRLKDEDGWLVSQVYNQLDMDKIRANEDARHHMRIVSNS
ncbi:hypothetical protein LCGC14_1028770 [marine sediment metagenome]|uniref:Uncharacterized protein n=1 Tax=marine sediment metagenome TaxID=412755 RepID=A0A0F9MZR9_9ZZZZ